MTSPDRPSRALLLAAATLAGLSVTLGACEKKKKPLPPPPVTNNEPEVVIPDPVDINGILAQVKPDARVQFPERNAPADASLAEAIVRFASDIAKGDSGGIRTKLAPEAQTILDTLVADGSWADETRKIEQVRITQLSPLQEAEVTRATIVMAIQAPGGAYPLAWEGEKNGTGWVFKSLSTEPIEKPRASDFDNVTVRIGAAFASTANAHTPPPSDGSTPEEQQPGKVEEPEKDPTEKQTPAGPIKIPQPGGS
jgi:hypothetical protein